MRHLLGFEIQHVGVNCSDGEEALAVARRFALLFGWPVSDNAASAFAGSAIEAMKGSGRGTKGHIAIATNSVMSRNGASGSDGHTDSCRLDPIQWQ